MCTSSWNAPVHHGTYLYPKIESVSQYVSGAPSKKSEPGNTRTPGDFCVSWLSDDMPTENDPLPWHYNQNALENSAESGWLISNSNVLMDFFNFMGYFPFCQ